MTPYFASMAEFFQMGDDGIYVWTSYAITVLAILAMIWHSRGQRRQVIGDTLTQAARQQQRKKSL